MKLLRAQTELARNEIRSTKSFSLPGISLYASNTLARPVSRTLADMYNNNWNVGVSVSYPLSSLYKNNHKIKESKMRSCCDTSTILFSVSCKDRRSLVNCISLRNTSLLVISPSFFIRRISCNRSSDSSMFRISISCCLKRLKRFIY